MLFDFDFGFVCLGGGGVIFQVPSLGIYNLYLKNLPGGPL